MVRSQDSIRVWLQLGMDFQGSTPYLEDIRRETMVEGLVFKPVSFKRETRGQGGELP